MIIVVTAFGNKRKALIRFVSHIREYTRMPIHIYTDDLENKMEGKYNCKIVMVETKWRGHRRYGYRNSNYWRMKLISLYDECVLYMDYDIRVVNEAFMEGFELANLFGMCLPLSPRIFLHSDISRGVDRQIKRKDLHIPHGSVCNSGMFFADPKNVHVQNYVNHYLKIYIDNPGRGPLAAWLAAEASGWHPYILPHQWLVCQANAEYCINYPYPEVKPIMIHLSGRKIEGLFKNEILHNHLSSS